MIDVNHNTWSIDSGSTIHVTNSLQDLRDLRKPMGSERSIYSGNKMSSHVEAVGTCSLVLSSGYILQLKKTFYIPGYSRNLISISRLVLDGYSFNFSDLGFNLFYKSDIIGYGTLFDGLFFLSLRNDDNHTIMHVHEKIGTK